MTASDVDAREDMQRFCEVGVGIMLVFLCLKTIMDHDRSD